MVDMANKKSLTEGERIPFKIIKKAEALGCRNTKYIYRDGDYGNKYPTASIGGKKCAPFRNLEQAEKFKVDLGQGWVAFRSPSDQKIKSGNSQEDPLSIRKIEDLQRHSLAIAQKHISVSLQIEDTVKELGLPYTTFIGTYGTGKSGQAYQTIEEESGRTYYSLKLYSTNPPKQQSHIKDPDVVIVDDHFVKYIIEVKWGYITGVPIESDLFKIFKGEEYEKHLQATIQGKVVRVRGPACAKGIRYRSNQFTHRDYEVMNNTKYLVISDFYNLHRQSPDQFNKLYQDIIKNKDNMIFLDIKQEIKDIPSLKDWLVNNFNNSRKNLPKVSR
jgi:hypothetical protein